MTASASHIAHLLKRAVISGRHETLLAPVFQHLPHSVARSAAPLHGYALLQGLLEGERDAEAIEDGVVPSVPLTLRQAARAIVGRRESGLDARAEEVEGIVELIVGQHVEGVEEGRLLHL